MNWAERKGYSISGAKNFSKRSQSFAVNQQLFYPQGSKRGKTANLDLYEFHERTGTLRLRKVDRPAQKKKCMLASLDTLAMASAQSPPNSVGSTRVNTHASIHFRSTQEDDMAQSPQLPINGSEVDLPSLCEYLVCSHNADMNSLPSCITQDLHQEEESPGMVFMNHGSGYQILGID